MKKDRSHHAVHITVSYNDDLLRALGHHIGKEKATPDDLRNKVRSLIRAFEEDLFYDQTMYEEDEARRMRDAQV